MRRTMLRILGPLTVCLVALTSVQAAAARGHAPAVGMMEICTGTGPVMVQVDANGAPTGGLMICPDYALAFFAHLDVAAPSSFPERSWQKIWCGTPAMQQAVSTTPGPNARSPPLSM
jgi:hypothetical protein